VDNDDPVVSRIMVGVTVAPCAEPVTRAPATALGSALLTSVGLASELESVGLALELESVVDALILEIRLAAPSWSIVVVCGSSV
jgi:hypothetical protein